jgi:hypothetical protein
MFQSSGNVFQLNIDGFYLKFAQQLIQIFPGSISAKTAGKTGGTVNQHHVAGLISALNFKPKAAPITSLGKLLL